MSDTIPEVDRVFKENEPESPENQQKALVVSRKINKTDKYFSVEWVRRLYNTIDNARDKAYIQYHIETGLRVQDVVKTEKRDVDWHNCRSYTYDHKKDSWRWVYFPEFVKATLKIWLKQSENEGILDKRLFPMSEKTANRIIQLWAGKIGFPLANLVSSHWCRHTFIRLSRQAGRDLVAVRQNTGDSYKTILEWYSGLNNEDMRAEFEKKPLVGEKSGE